MNKWIRPFPQASFESIRHTKVAPVVEWVVIGLAVQFLARLVHILKCSWENTEPQVAHNGKLAPCMVCECVCERVNENR